MPCFPVSWIWDGLTKEVWEPRNWCFWTVVLEKTFEGPSDSKEIKPVNPKANKPWIFIRRTDAEASILWLPDVKSWHIGKDPDAGKDWRQEKTGMTEDEMVGLHHWLDGHDFEKALGVSDGKGSLCAAIHGVPESPTGLSNWTELKT